MDDGQILSTVFGVVFAAFIIWVAITTEDDPVDDESTIEG